MMMAGTTRLATRAPGSRRRGVATVELALVLPTLVLLLFGTLEIGFMAKQAHSLNHVAREAARIASTGATNARIAAHIADVAPGMNAGQIEATLEQRTWDPQSNTWGSWSSLTDDGVENSAGTGDQIRVSLQYSYTLITGGLMASVLNASEDNTF